MRIKLNEIPEIVLRPATGLTKHPHKGSGRDIACQNELKVAAAIAEYGHLRIAEIARLGWPLATYADQMAQRTCRRMVGAGRLLIRRNALGGTSYVLTRTGASWLSLRGTQARHTLELSSVGGATFFHRTLATRYLLERAIKGAGVAGEYKMANGGVPFSIETLTRATKKNPDGLIWRENKDGSIAFEWLEVENASKPKSELVRMLRVAMFSGKLVDVGKKAYAAGLNILYNKDLNHADRILSAANELWGGLPEQKRDEYERKVVLISASIAAPLVWLGHSSKTLQQYRQEKKNVAIRSKDRYVKSTRGNI